jgi:hypothetical protein
MDSTRHGRTREDLSYITGIRTYTIRFEILYDVIPSLFFKMTSDDTSGLPRTAATVPIDVMGEILRVHPDGATEVDGGELTLGNHAPNGPGREPKDLGDLIDQVELG